MHGAHNYPFRKEVSDLDIGLPDGTDGPTYLRILAEHLPRIIEEFRPTRVFYLSGVDVIDTDKYGKLKLTIAECRARDEYVFSLAQKHSLPCAVAMGGGYSADVRRIVDAHCNTFRAAREMFGL
jgi:acetoin utilization deacetylase AcuC-like enzyme